jgi:hypothetical protein
MKERFTPEEWSQLKVLPFQVFALVAASDEKIDQKELDQLQSDLKNAAFYRDPLHREIALDILTSDMQSLIQQALDVSQFAPRASSIKTFLTEKLSTEEYQRFMGSLFIDGLKVARASGGGAFGLGDKVSGKEKLALTMLATLFGLDVNTLSEHFG